MPPHVQDVTWDDLGGLDLPVSLIDGPQVDDNGVVSGFEPNGRGAAFAAVHLLVRTFPFAGPRIFAPTIARHVTGPYAATLGRLTSQAYQQLAPAAGAKDGGPISADGGWVAGYRIDTATDAPTETANRTAHRTATVRVLIRQLGEGGVDGFTEYRVQLVWRDGDWQLVAPTWGDWRTAARAMTDADPAGYVSYENDPGGSGSHGSGSPSNDAGRS
jgi:hypothetical protein